MLQETINLCTAGAIIVLAAISLVKDEEMLALGFTLLAISVII